MTPEGRPRRASASLTDLAASETVTPQERAEGQTWQQPDNYIADVAKAAPRGYGCGSNCPVLVHVGATFHGVEGCRGIPFICEVARCRALVMMAR